MVMSFENGDKIYHVELNNMVAAHEDNGVLYGLEITAQSTPSMTVNISPGECYIGNEVESESAITTATINNAHSVYPRIDTLVYYPQFNRVFVLTGIAEATPKPKDIGNGRLLLALIHIPAQVSVITNDLIEDERIFIKPVGLIYEASNTLIASSDAEEHHNTPYYIKEKEIPIVESIFDNNSTFRIGFDIRSTLSGGAVYGRIYRNGTAVGAVRSTVNTWYSYFAEDIGGWSTDDFIQLYTNSNYSTRSVYVKNFRVYGDIKPKSLYNW